ncbi:hypothetical protein Gotur_016387 [Gossypium turneri]
MDRSVYHTPSNPSRNNGFDRKWGTTFFGKWPKGVKRKSTNERSDNEEDIKVLIPHNIGEPGLHVVTLLLNVATTKNIQIIEPALNVVTLLSGVTTPLRKIDYQMASLSVSTSSPAVEFQEGDMDKYLQQLQPYTFIKEQGFDPLMRNCKGIWKNAIKKEWTKKFFHSKSLNNSNGKGKRCGHIRQKPQYQKHSTKADDTKSQDVDEVCLFENISHSRDV